MANPKWTPGPWEVTTVGNGDRRDIAVKQASASWGDGGIAVVVSDHRSNDAHLIAAAPDLYEACEATYRYLNRLNTHTREQAKVFALVRAALSKARGESDGN